MKGLKIALIAVLATLAIGLLVVMGGMITGRFHFYNFFWGENWGMSEDGTVYGNTTLQADTEVPGNDIRAVEVNFSKTGCDILFLPSPDGTLRVKEYYNAEVAEDKKARIKVDGNTLVVQQMLYPGVQSGIRRISGYVEIYLPDTTYASLKQLEASTTSGNISLPKWEAVDNMEMEKLDFSTTSGDIDVDLLQSVKAQLSSTSGNLTVGRMQGDLTMSATSGDMEVLEIDGRLQMDGTSGNQTAGIVRGNLHMESTSGDVKAGTVTGDVEMDTVSGWQQVGGMTGKGSFGSTSGDITVSLDEMTGDITCDSTSGDVDITVPRDSSFSLSIESTSGSVKTSFDDQLSFNKRRTSAEGNIGTSLQYRVKVETTSGSIKVYEK